MTIQAARASAAISRVMRSRIMRLGVLSAGIAGVAARAVAQQAAPGSAHDSSGVLRGTLVNAADGQPVPYATVSLIQAGRSVFANATGAFRVAHLAPGQYTCACGRSATCHPIRPSSSWKGAGRHTVIARLTRIAVNLAQIKVEGQRGKGCVTGIPD